MIREGDAGDRFLSWPRARSPYAGTASRSPLGQGTYFGEIALLHDVPRVATVTAVTNATFLVLDRGDGVLGRRDARYRRWKPPPAT